MNMTKQEADNGKKEQQEPEKIDAIEGLRQIIREQNFELARLRFLLGKKK